MLKNLLICFTLFLALPGYGQFSLSGKVTDSATNQILPGATITLNPTKAISQSDQLGFFSFDNISPGTYSVILTYVGFQSKTEQVVVTENTSIAIAMTRASIITDAVVITATRSTEKTPTTYTTVNKEALQLQNFGQDVPFLINWTPSVVTTSDAGTGIGYSGIRIRGSDPTRVNVTINGIPYNDSESLGTFWVDIPDIATSTQSIQIQRGVGTSTNGAGAFGATINLQTNTRKDEPYAEVINSGGSFFTRRHSFSLGTGLLNNHWVVEARVSKIRSDGFIDRGSSDLSSYYFTAGYYGKNTLVKAIVFGGKERTYQSWYGVPESRLNNDVEAMETTAINEGWNAEQTENLLSSNSRTFNPYTYKNQVDDYKQDHYQLHFAQKINSFLTANAALHYTPGKGYYEEYKFMAPLSNYGLAAIIVDDDGNSADNDTITNVDLIRRRWLDNDFYGVTYSLNVDKNKWNFVWGGGWNRYDGDHFGEIIWAEISTVPTEYRYYHNNGEKTDFNTFVKINYQITAGLNGFVDLQYRAVNYEASGIENNLNQINIDSKFNFFNPKFGVTYSLGDRQQLYTSYAIGNREPLRDDFIAMQDDLPEHETLQNIELGYRKAGEKYMMNANYYFMNYKNQLVLTGDLNDVGAPLRKNAGSSYRMGIELEAGLKLLKNIQWNANLTISRNKIQSYTEILEDYGDNFDQFNIVKKNYNDTDISFSPDVVAGSQLTFTPFKNSSITLLTKYVGKQYLDNTENNNRSIDSYFINDLRLHYSWKPVFVKEISFNLLINNFLNEMYESNGYTYGYLAGSATYRENYYYPQAGRNFLMMLVVKI